VTLNIPESTADNKALDQSKRDQNTRSSAARGQQLIAAGSPIVEKQDSQNGILLLSGEHGGFRLQKPGTRLVGAPGALVTNTGTIESDCVIQDLVFTRKPGSNNGTYLLRVTSTAKVLIRNCIFERRPGDKSSTGAADEESFILVEDGGKAIVVECTFRSTSGNGRRISKEQFATGTTIDGDRLESVFQDIEKLVNSIPSGDLLNRWVHQHFHVGYLPLTARADANIVAQLTVTNSIAPKGPWLPVSNKVPPTGSPTPVGPDPTNDFRVKGNRLPYFPPATQYPTFKYNIVNGLGAEQIAWEVSFALSTPSILHSVNAYFLTDDTEYTNSFKYGGTAPTERTASTFAKDVQFHISIDNPFTPEDRRTSNNIFHVREFDVSGSMMANKAGTPTNDMSPALSTIVVPATGAAITFKPDESLAFESSELKIPLPIDTRIRITCILPIRRTAASAVDGPWFQRPFSFMPSMSVTLLEPLLD